MTAMLHSRTNTFNHAFDLAFSLTSRDRAAADVTPQMLRDAILRRVASLTDTELIEAVGAPFDTYREDAPSNVSRISPQEIRAFRIKGNAQSESPARKHRSAA